MNLGELTAEQPSKTSIDSTTVLIMTIAVVAALAIALEVATARRKNHN
jgi:flagellar basal body-associated protein FliL